MPETLSTKASQRFVSLDAYRGAIMISLISVGFGFSAFQGHPILGFVARHMDHVAWKGCVYWDLIQPAFMFMVGVAMPFAYARRRSLGESHARVLGHVVKRAILLVLIAALFTSIQEGHPTITFINVLPQIAIGYFLAFFVLNQSYTVQGLTAALILIIYTLVWVLYPANGEGGPWAQGNVNIGSDFDKWLMGKYYSGLYVGMNAIPSTATIIFGVMCGRLVAGELSQKQVMKILAVAAIALFAAGLALSPVVPIIKRIWTASFTLYSAGWVILFLLLFYWIIEVRGYQRWTLPLVVVGMNSIAAYIIFQLFRGWINNAILAFSKPLVSAMGAWGSVLQACLVLGAIWYVLYFFYRKKIFFKV
jgi:predicted acyltransferase